MSMMSSISNMFSGKAGGDVASTLFKRNVDSLKQFGRDAGNALAQGVKAVGNKLVSDGIQSIGTKMGLDNKDISNIQSIGTKLMA
jgi:hypothetical protein